MLHSLLCQIPHRTVTTFVSVVKAKFSITTANPMMLLFRTCLQCFEYFLGTDGTIQTWLNGNLISGMTAGPNASNPNDAGWTREAYVPDITGVYFGWEAYSGDINTVWFDDVAIETSRVGCGGPASSGTTSIKPTSTAHSTTSNPGTTTKPSTTIPPTTSKTTSSVGATQT
jgi:hypothetical protein